MIQASSSLGLALLLWSPCGVAAFHAPPAARNPYPKQGAPLRSAPLGPAVSPDQSLTTAFGVRYGRDEPVFDQYLLPVEPREPTQAAKGPDFKVRSDATPHLRGPRRELGV